MAARLPTFLFSALIAASLSLRASDSSQSDNQLAKFLYQNHYGPVPTMGRNNQETFTAQINGKPVRLVLDSGADVTVLTKACADRVGLPTKVAGNAGGVGGYIKLGIAPIASFMINNWAINRASTIHVAFAEGRRLSDGLFGYDELQLNSALIIVGGEGFLIRPGVAGRPPSLDGYMRQLGYKPVPLRIVHHKLTVEGVAEGVPFVAKVDTGAQYSLFSEQFFKRLRLQPLPYSGFGFGIDGRILREWVFSPDSFKIGESVTHYEWFFEASGTTFPRDGLDGLLGFDFLSKKKAVIDAGSNTLWLK